MELFIHRGMKMNDIDEKDQELLGKRVIHQLINNQLKDLKEDKQEDNNSFIFLEKSTLNLLMTYLLMNSSHKDVEEVSGDNEAILKEIEQAITENKKEFEEIIAKLKAVR